MKAEILCVGTELLLGDIVNTNAAYIAEKLAGIGIELYYQTVVGDNPKRLKKCIHEGFARADAIIMTGGLGPTYDDLTKETVAEYFGLPLEEDKDAMAELKHFFKNIGREMTENNKKQAMIPKGARALKNRRGTAPGIALEKDGKVAVLLPGPPGEMRPMFEESVVPLLKKYTDKVIVSHTVTIAGLGESNVESQLREQMVEMTNPTLAPYAKIGEVRLRVTASAKSEEEAEDMIAPVTEKLREMFGENAYAIDAEDLPTETVKRLIECNIKIAVAESCTGGLISKRITDVAGASAIFGTGVCTYANSAKEKILGVKKETLRRFGAVSPETAKEMAEGVRALADADIGLSTTGIAGPDGGTSEKPVGLVYIGIATKHGTEVIKHNAGDTRGRDHVRQSAAAAAFFEIIKASERIL